MIWRFFLKFFTILFIFDVLLNLWGCLSFIWSFRNTMAIEIMKKWSVYSNVISGVSYILLIFGIYLYCCLFYLTIKSFKFTRKTGLKLIRYLFISVFLYRPLFFLLNVGIYEGEAYRQFNLMLIGYNLIIGLLFILFFSYQIIRSKEEGR